MPVAVVVPVAAVVVASAGLVCTTCPRPCELSSAHLLEDLLRDAHGAAIYVVLGVGARLASLGAVKDNATAVGDDAVVD